MPATITKLKPRPERLRQDEAERAKAAVRQLEATGAVPPHVVREFYQAVERNTASRAGWVFVMLSPAQNAAVVGYLAKHSTRPVVAMRLWALCFQHLREDTGEILVTRDEFAEMLQEDLPNISRIMTELETCGAIIRRREKVPGMRGRGYVRYFMNPLVATRLGGEARDRAQEAAPPLLVLMEGGKPEPA